MKKMLEEPRIEVCGAMLVLLSSLLAAVGTLPLSPLLDLVYENVQHIIVSAFAVEFVARWYSSWSEKKFWGYLTQPLAVVDVAVVIVPLLLPILSGLPFSPSALVNLRLLRILRLQRVLQNMGTFQKFTGALGLPGFSSVKPYQLQLARVVLSLFTLLSVSTGLIYAAEHTVNPDMDNYFTALYFGLTTLTTVGFGDITPVTLQGKLVVSGSILAGVALIPAQAAALADALLNSQNQQELPPPNTCGNAGSLPPSTIVDATTPCQLCGATFHWNSANFCWSCGTKLYDDMKPIAST
jgi:voltage-gated potassium channel